jgi:Domain of unknown function (DUF4160)
MGKVFSGDCWIIKVQGDEHPPVHAHVLHPDGKASVSVDGLVHNSGVPAKVIAAATAWIVENAVTVNAEWEKMNNPRKR